VKVALDTNILAYAEGVNGAAMQRRAIDLLERLIHAEIVLPVQALGELATVLVRKGERTKAAAHAAVLEWTDAYPAAETTLVVMIAAAGLAADHDLGLWDAVILSTAASSGCRLLLSQDFQDGFTWNGVTVADPFADTAHPVLKRCIEDAAGKRGR